MRKDRGVLRVKGAACWPRKRTERKKILSLARGIRSFRGKERTQNREPREGVRRRGELKTKIRLPAPKRYFTSKGRETEEVSRDAAKRRKRRHNESQHRVSPCHISQLERINRRFRKGKP